MPELRVTLTVTVNRDDIPDTDGITNHLDLCEAVAQVLEQDAEIGGVPVRDVEVDDCQPISGYCGHELCGADGGPCPDCGTDTYRAHGLGAPDLEAS